MPAGRSAPLVRDERDLEGMVLQFLIDKQVALVEAKYFTDHGDEAPEATRKQILETALAGRDNARDRAHQIVKSAMCNRSAGWGEWWWGVIGNVVGAVAFGVLAIVVWMIANFPSFKEFAKSVLN